MILGSLFVGGWRNHNFNIWLKTGRSVQQFGEVLPGHIHVGKTERDWTSAAAAEKACRKTRPKRYCAITPEQSPNQGEPAHVEADSDSGEDSEEYQPPKQGSKRLAASGSSSNSDSPPRRPAAKVKKNQRPRLEPKKKVRMHSDICPRRPRRPLSAVRQDHRKTSRLRRSERKVHQPARSVAARRRRIRPSRN